MCLNSRMRVYEVRYEDGVLKPKEPLPFPFGEILRVTLVRSPDPKRWERWEKAVAQTQEEKHLTESGLDEWTAMLDVEDRR
jgi:predicted DNA-binding antitoxin AbrB/MazE fold protein